MKSMKLDNVDIFYNVLNLIDKIYPAERYYFHGSPDISYLNSVTDIKPKFNTIKTKYFYITPYVRTALSFCADSNYQWKSERSGIGVFKIKQNSKVYKFSKSDFAKVPTSNKFEDYLDDLSANYDLVKGTQNTQEIIVLNTSCLKLINVVYITDLMEQFDKI